MAGAQEATWGRGARYCPHWRQKGRRTEARPCSRSHGMTAAVRSHGLEEAEPRVMGDSHVLLSEMDHLGLRKPRDLSSGSLTYGRAQTSAVQRQKQGGR